MKKIVGMWRFYKPHETKWYYIEYGILRHSGFSAHLRTKEK